MNITWLIYLADIAGNAKNSIGALCLIFIVVTFVVLFWWCVTSDNYSDESHDKADKALKYIVKRLWIFLLFLSLDIFMPSRNTIYLMLSTRYISDTKIPSKVMDIINMNLDGIIIKMKKEKDK